MKTTGRTLIGFAFLLSAVTELFRSSTPPTERFVACLGLILGLSLLLHTHRPERLISWFLDLVFGGMHPTPAEQDKAWESTLKAPPCNSLCSCSPAAPKRSEGGSALSRQSLAPSPSHPVTVPRPRQTTAVLFVRHLEQLNRAGAKIGMSFVVTGALGEAIEKARSEVRQIDCPHPHSAIETTTAIGGRWNITKCFDCGKTLNLEDV